MTNLEHYCYGAEHVTESDDIMLYMVNCWKTDWMESGIDDLDKWLLSDYKPYKLKQSEHDLLEAISDWGYGSALFKNLSVLRNMSFKGYFEGVDPAERVDKILRLSEVISDD